MKSNEERIKSIMHKVDEYKEHRRKRNAMITSVGCFIFLISGLGIISFNNANITNELSRFALETDELPRFTSEAELLAALENTEREEYSFGSDMIIFESALDDSVAVTNQALTKSESQSVKESFSETNTQVQGVDESDIVKTNGEYIYYLSEGYLRIFETKTSDTKLVKEIKITQDNFYGVPSELYINDDHIVVLATTRIYIDNEETEDKKVRSYYKPRKTSTKALIYDINSYELEREFEIEGNYVSSRKVDNDFYIVTNKYINNYGKIIIDDVVPLYRDSVLETNEYCKIAATDIRYIPDFDKKDCSYMIISSFNLDKIDNEVEIYTCLGSGNEIYASRENLYVAKINYDYKIADKTTTAIHKFAIKDGKVKYEATGSVPGALLNQFSMDEYEGNFRITTTKGNTWDDTSENNLYVLDEKLNIVGTLEGLAKGEKIYSTRFMGEKCYVVTYKTVDPLFVIDLSNPEIPKVLGELKIPGYSKYLHPLGENYLIGFGEDSVEKSYLDWQGEMQVTAYATGLKMAIFDVTDYNNPKELHSIKMGGRGSYSELLNNHKSLLFNEEEGIFAFPATLTEETKYYANGTPKYGETIFNGALIYNVSVEEGISLRGKVEHKIEGRKNNNNIQRLLYIGDRLYTLSSDMIKVSNLKTIEELDALIIK